MDACSGSELADSKIMIEQSLIILYLKHLIAFHLNNISLPNVFTQFSLVCGGRTSRHAVYNLGEHLSFFLYKLNSSRTRATFCIFVIIFDDLYLLRMLSV